MQPSALVIVCDRLCVLHPLLCPAVVLTIHQPRSSIYKMFDQLMLLSEGRVMYFGAASAATAYFAQCGFECPAQVRLALPEHAACGWLLPA